MAKNNTGLVLGLAGLGAGFLALKNLNISAPPITMGGFNFGFPEFEVPNFDFSGLASLAGATREIIIDRPKEFFNNVVDDGTSAIFDLADNVQNVPQEILDFSKDALADFALNVNVLDLAAAVGLGFMTGGIAAPAIFAGVNLATQRASGDSLTSQIGGNMLAEILAPGFDVFKFGGRAKPQSRKFFTDFVKKLKIGNILSTFGVDVGETGIGFGPGSGERTRIRGGGMSGFGYQNALTRAITNAQNFNNSAASPGMDRPSGGGGRHRRRISAAQNLTNIAVSRGLAQPLPSALQAGVNRYFSRRGR